METGNISLLSSEINTDRNKRTLMWLLLQNNKREFCCCNLHWSTDINNHALQANTTANLAYRFIRMPFIA